MAQPKRLAVLAYVAARPVGTFVRRDALLGVFWPELDQAAARRSLRQALHVLRAQVHADVLVSRGDDEVALNPQLVRCDVPQFLAAMAERRWAEALDLYRGDLLAGFFLSGGGVPFERWLEDERARLRDWALGAATVLAEAAERGGEPAAAAAWARRGLALAPEDEVALRRLLRLLERAGDRAGALRAYDTFARRLLQDLGEAPSEETQRLVARMRTPPLTAERTHGAPPQPAGRTPSRRRWVSMASAAGIVALGVGGGTLYARRATPSVLAVGDVARGDSLVPAQAAEALPELLATDLARVGGLSVLSHPRVVEVAGQLAAGQRSPSFPAAARAAGAREIIEGTVYRVGDSLRLDLRQVDVRRGVVRGAVTLAGRDVFALADSAAAFFARRFGLAAPARGLADVTSASLTAHALYDEGLRTYYGTGDTRTAARLFRAALDQDSTFAMAAYYLGRVLESEDPAASGAAYERAARFAAHASEREALLVRVQWPATQNEPGWIAMAESLGSRYPGEPEGRYDEGLAREREGDYAGAVRAFRAAIALDSLGFRTLQGRCLACDAAYRLVWVEISEDSLAAARGDARRWLELQPRAAQPWDTWSVVLEREGRLAEALAARDTADRLRGAGGATAIDRAYFLIRAGDYAAADRLLESSEQAGSPEERREALWWHIVGLRNEGRPHLAVALARRYLAQDRRAYITLGQVLLEAGDLSGAAWAFDSAAVDPDTVRRLNPGEAARHRAWALAQRANVAAARLDTNALRLLADSVAVAARGSAFGRDRRLPAYVHGLLLERRGRLDAAVDSFRAAVYSPTEGYTRVNQALARTLLALGRPREAISWMQAALRGGMEASDYYLTRSDAHELLARCFAAAGLADSARAHYQAVARAWAHAEPGFQSRLADTRRYLATRSSLARDVPRSSQGRTQ